MSLEQSLLALSLVTPFLTALFTVVAGEKNYRGAALVLPFATLISVVLLAVRFVQSPQTITIAVGEIAPGLSLSLSLEPLGMIFALVVAILWPISMLYSVEYLAVNKLPHRMRFCSCFALAIGSSLGVAFAGDLLSLLIFYEALTLSTYPLVTHSGDEKARRAGRIYLGFLLGTSIMLLLPAIIWVWLSYGTLVFKPGGIFGDNPPHPAWLLIFAFGIGKAALMPLHRWLPEAMVAPVPVSALLHAVAVVKAGVFTLMKIIIYIFGVDALAAPGGGWLVYLAGLSVIAASFIALRQDNLKKRLAYSTVGHLSYIAMGAALLKPAIVGAMLHLAAHAVGKIMLFFVAGAIQTTSGKSKVSELNGIGRNMPWTMACFTLGALALFGLPPTFGFISKWHLVGGAMDAQHGFAVTVLIASTILSAAYLFPIVYRAYVFPAKDRHPEVSPGMLLPMLLCGAAMLLLFFFSDSLIRLTEQIRYDGT